MSRQPEVLWAQRSDRVYLTVSVPDARGISVNCEPEGIFSFSAIGPNGEPFNVSLELYGKIAPQGCKTKTGLRNILCTVMKEQKGWWKRLLKSEEKPAPYIKVDWYKWCDEDEDESEGTDHGSKYLLTGREKFINYWVRKIRKQKNKKEVDEAYQPSDEDSVNNDENEESSDDEGMLYLPDLEKARATNFK